MRFARCLAFLPALLPGLVQAQTAAPLDPDDPPAVVRTGADPFDRVTIPIQIDGKGPYHFIIDTGSQRTVVSRQLAKQLALPADGQVKVLSMTGFADVATVTVPSLSFGASRVSGIQAPVFDDTHLGAPGLLGLDSLERKRVMLDFRTGRMDITASSPYARLPKDHDEIIVEAKTKLGQLILVDSHADGRKVNVILDTGSEYSIGNSALLKKLSKKRPQDFVNTVAMTSVTGDQLIGHWGRIDKITLGGIAIRDVIVIFADASPFKELGLDDKPALMLGVNVLRSFDRVAIDFGRRRVDFRLPEEGAIQGSQLAMAQTGAGVEGPAAN